MKKSFLCILAALAALTGCRKAPATDAPAVFVFSSEASATRTEWDGTTIQWSEGDAISMAYTISGNWQGPSLLPSAPLGKTAHEAHFTVPVGFDSPEVGAHTFYTVYPAAAATDFPDAPEYMTAIPTRQTPAADSYDPAADLMVGISDTYRSRPAGTIPLRWTRLVAHGDLTLNNLGLAAEEKVASVTLTAQDRAELTGDILVDISTGECATAGVNTVFLDGSNLSPEADGSLHCWVSIFPVTLTALEVRVETDLATYTKSFSGFSKTFVENARNILSINMKDATVVQKEQPGTEYVRTSSDAADWTGDYLIVYTEGSVALKAGTTSASSGTGESVTISKGVIPAAGNEALNIRIEKSGNAYTMKQGDVYLGLNSSSNALHFSESASDGYLWTFAVSNGDILVRNANYSTRFLQWNKSARIFRCYTGSQENVQFYKLDGSAGGQGGDTPATPTVTTGSASSVSRSEATLHATYTGDATYGGFEYGLSPGALTSTVESQYVTGSAFSALLDNLVSGTTYYYRAYIAILEGSQYQYYYGSVQQFTTPSDEQVGPSDNQPGWAEVPLMEIGKDGNYMVNTSDPSQYFAIHLCTGGEKGPGGKTARNYTVCYSAEHHCPVWVAAPRHAMYVGSAGRNDSYRQDPNIPSGIQYTSKSTGGGCNKGHMLGSAERTSSKSTNRDVFYYPNIAPQLSSGFNTGGGGWNTLEDWVDTQVCADTLYEVIGCYFKAFSQKLGGTTYSTQPSTISFGGRNDVSMPTMFYYVLLRTKSGNSHKSVKDCSSSELKCAAFVRAHTNSMKGVQVSSAEMMSVSDLEQLVGVTFFPNVPNAPKSSFNASDWGL